MESRTFTAKSRLKASAPRPWQLVFAHGSGNRVQFVLFGSGHQGREPKSCHPLTWRSVPTGRLRCRDRSRKPRPADRLSPLGRTPRSNLRWTLGIPHLDQVIIIVRTEVLFQVLHDTESLCLGLSGTTPIERLAFVAKPGLLSALRSQHPSKYSRRFLVFRMRCEPQCLGVLNSLLHQLPGASGVDGDHRKL